ncbi:cytochrome b/b6 domain-containing protein [Variovorax sp. J22R133]|uniref:cytochrome b/b6 domain-containing protein n=1 Tax=Variovorax brevis TaxID=3053503 RepID=UPI002574EE17|nr:cytochrome b/b6 domain-containing protein [Variovorax sp. J22R133]MDM0110679.1 cytochrome b/b6 domain-containing protein [Variovorax sp. J22R133]
MPGPHGGALQVWDAIVRLSHAVLAGCVIYCWFQDDGGPAHRQVGYVAAGAVGVRLLWAVLSKGHGRLSALRPSLRATLDYVRAGTPRTIGHDPLGLWMVWLMWTLVLLLALTGWMSRWDMFWGDERVQEVHAWISDALMAAVVLHLLGVAVMSWRWRENLPGTMVTGRKRVADAKRMPMR